MKYRKKPVIVDAQQFWPDVKPWPEGVGVCETTTPGGTPLNKCPVVETLSGIQMLEPGDWVITDKGARYTCDPEVFAAGYEEA